MVVSDLVWTIFFLAQTSLGLLGNSTLLMLYINIFITHPYQRKSTDLILTHLTVANTMTLLTQCAPGMVMAFGLKTLVGTIGCQIVLYIRRVARALSICTTCLLSVFQAITISPSTSLFAQLKPRAPSYIFPSFVFFWILNLFIDINFLKSVVAIRNDTITVSVYRSKSCSSSQRESLLKQDAFVSLMTLRDVFFVFLMSWTSGYMVVVLHQHQKQVQHIHSNSLSPQFSAEAKATQTILLLVISFVCFYCINSSFNLTLYFVPENDLRFYDPVLFLGACYAFFCPFVLISKDPRVPTVQGVLKKIRGTLGPLDSSQEQQVTSLPLSQPTDSL
ncbi:vomeronasal 1 receptor ornAnaV1R3114 [Ornithorhynchus anatinus]|uniref:Vomeronasal type-1 receptor n=1 Tax=Ornithorhynchus anatinus TaxID=9258 RepID=F6U1N1_ORNAN|nr:vomeronasal 1 receptor ornAnaV1R3114 [Ornithorhynchus anatinus]